MSTSKFHIILFIMHEHRAAINRGLALEKLTILPIIVTEWA